MQKFYSVILAAAVAVSASASVFNHDAKLPELRQINKASLCLMST